MNEWLNMVNDGPEFHKNQTVITVLSFIEIDSALVWSFHDAARKGDISKVVDMVEVGMPVDIADKNGKTALMWAASHNFTDVVHFLLIKGADEDKRNPAGDTVLHDASYKNHTDVIRTLLQHGATSDIKNDEGNRQINLAGHEEAVRLLQQY